MPGHAGAAAMTDNERKAQAWITAEVLRQHGWKAWPVLAGPIEVVSIGVAIQVLLAVVQAKGETMQLRRNAMIEDECGFTGRWVAVPEEDYDRNVVHAADVPEPPG